MITKKSDYIGFTDVFEFSIDLKKQEKNKRCSDYIDFTDVFECCLSSQASRVRSEDFM